MNAYCLYLSIASCAEQVREIQSSVQGAGLETPAIQDIDGVTALFMKDPDGIRFEISHYPPGMSVVD